MVGQYRRAGHEGVVKLLLETGKVDANSKDDQYGQTLLSWAAMRGHEGVVKPLLTVGAAVDAEDKNRRTALLLATNNGHENVIKLLTSPT